MSGTEIRTCTCMSEFQDNVYGNNKRLMNINTKGCAYTVCGKDLIGRTVVIDTPPNSKKQKK